MESTYTNHNGLNKVLFNFRHEFFWAGIFSLIANLLTLSPTLYMLQIYDRVLASQSELTLVFMSIIVVLLFALMAFAEWSRSILLVRAGVRLDQALNTRVFNASFEAHLDQAKQISRDAFFNLATIRQFLTGNGIIALFDAPWTPIYIGVLFILHPLLGYIGIGFAATQLLMAYISYRLTFSVTEISNTAETNSKVFISSKLKNVESVQAMGMLDNLRARWLSLHMNHQASLNISNNRQWQQQSLTKFVRYCMQSLTLGAAAMLVIKGELGVGAMIAANVLMVRVLYPLDLMVGSWRDFVQAKVAYLQLVHLITSYPEGDPYVRHPILKGDMTLKDLMAFSPLRAAPILDKLNIEFNTGQVTAIIGPSGSGKSTLARCLLGIWPYKEGLVLLDKTPIENWDREQLGQFIGYLPQDIDLLEGTLAENIGRFTEMDSKKIISAAKQVGIHEMILRFPMGYNTQINDTGSILSGGQKQRIGLARALYGNPTIIVLDEPNANLDDLGEHALIKAIQELKAQGKTIFIISHRRNILNVADFIMVLKEGKVVNYGLRDNVLANSNKVASSNSPSADL